MPDVEESEEELVCVKARPIPGEVASCGVSLVAESPPFSSEGGFVPAPVGVFGSFSESKKVEKNDNKNGVGYLSKNVFFLILMWLSRESNFM